MNGVTLNAGIGTEGNTITAVVELGRRLDEIACRVLKNDCPPFLLPFTIMEINGQTLLRYEVGSRISMDYFTARLTQAEFVTLWKNLLDPLLSCKDWFLHHAMLSYDPRYVLIDRHSLRISYLCLPMENMWAEEPALKTFLTGIMNQCELLDSPSLAIAFYKYFAQPEFSVAELRRLLSAHDTPATAQAPALENKSVAFVPPMANIIPPAPPPFRSVAPSAISQDEALEQELLNHMAGEKKEKKSIFGFGKPKEPKLPKATHPKKEKLAKEKPSKKDQIAAALGELAQPSEVIRGAAAAYVLPTTPYAQPSDPHAHPSVSHTPPPIGDDRTEMLFESDAATGPMLRLGNPAAHPELPREIAVQFQNGMFRVGRYDTSRGVQQSEFEFAATCKSVSRQHALLRQTPGGGCCIVDLGSGNGTFVNGARIPTNQPVVLKSGDCIGFSDKGLDYILIL